MTTDIPKEVKIILIQQEISLHKNSAYQLTLRHRVNKQLGASAEELKALQDELVKHEQAVDILEKELEVVESE